MNRKDFEQAIKVNNQLEELKELQGRIGFICNSSAYCTVKITDGNHSIELPRFLNLVIADNLNSIINKERSLLCEQLKRLGVE